MRKMRVATLGSVSLVVALVVAACGSSQSTVTPVSSALAVSDRHPQYFSDVRSARALTGENFENFNEVFGRIWPVREALLGALTQAGVGTTFDGTVDALDAMTPPQEVQGDHEILLAGTRELARLDRQAADAVSANDLVSFALINGQLGSNTFLTNGRLSPGYCASLSESGEGSLDGCRPLEPVPGGNYGSDLHGELRNFVPSISLAAASTAFALSLTPEEVAQVVQTELPQVIKILAETRARILALTPPSEFEADHERLVLFLEDVEGATRETAGLAALDPLALRSGSMRLMEQVERFSAEIVVDDFRVIVSPLLPPPGEVTE